MPTLCPSCGVKNLEGVDECKNCGADLRAVDLPRAASQIEQSVMHLPLTALVMSVIHTLAPDDPLDVAVQTLRRQKVDVLEIVEDGRLVGVLSVRDIVNRVGPDYRAKLDQPVRNFMTPRPETLPPDAPITYAINKMDVGGYRHVPVVQGDRMIGVVSSGDVIQYLIDNSSDQVVTVGTTTSHGVKPRPDHA